MNLQELSTIWIYTDSTPLSADEEVALIESAQSGSEQSFMILVRAYGPILRQSVTKASKTADREEAQSQALLAFSEVLYSHDPHDPNYKNGRLAPRLTPHLRDRLGEVQAQSASAFTVKKRSYSRYLEILNAADGDHNKALDLAPSMEMSRGTFVTIMASVQVATHAPTTSDDEDHQDEEYQRGTPVTVDEFRPEYDKAEDNMLIETAFRALEDDEARIVELAYGFTEYDPAPDAEIAHRLGLTRPTVQRRRGKALDKMRVALGVTLPKTP